MTPRFLLVRQVRGHARRDAEAALDNNLDAVVTDVLGRRPRSIGELESAVMLERQARPAMLEAATDEREDAERALEGAPPTTLLLFAIAACFVIEVIGCAYVLGTLGYSPVERMTLAVGLTLGSTLIAGIATGGGDGRRTGALGYLKRGAAILFVTVLACSMAWLRASSTDDLTPADVLTSGIALVVATAAPSVVTHWAASRLRTVTGLRRRLRAARAEERRRHRSRDRAIAARVDVERESAEYDARAAEVRAIYMAEYRRARAAQDAK
ncbi:MAG: hypothetical protein IT379_15055 [Deltaproteobacteria bacterium]|nr:hypothetical protein [Deltaproteobacteria bacterium]